jgi:rRNA-processing protein EBP2
LGLRCIAPPHHHHHYHHRRRRRRRATTTCSYDATLSAALQAYTLLKEHGVPVARPSDYYTEMLKTDDHMRRVRERLLEETQKVESSERARKQRHNKKFGKQIQQQIALKRQTEKSASINAAHKQRTQLKQKLNNQDDFDVEIEDAMPDSKKAKTMSRKSRDGKYGFGGKKNNGRGKMNNADSFIDHGKFPVRKNKESVKSGGKGGKGGGKGGKGGGKGGGGSSSGKKGRSVVHTSAAFVLRMLVPVPLRHCSGALLLWLPGWRWKCVALRFFTARASVCTWRICVEDLRGECLHSRTPHVPPTRTVSISVSVSVSVFVLSNTFTVICHVFLAGEGGDN